MGTYVPNTKAEQQKMLESCGFQSFDEMYACIPEELRLRKPLELPEGKTELEVTRAAEAAARKNRVYTTVFRGAGAYRHFIPSIVREVVGKEEFRTAYTPYQAEISQGVLQSIFEFQTDICELTGMAAANASVYDGATAAAEACEMCREKTRQRILVSATVDPKILSVVRTYSFGRGTEVAVVPEKDGVTDPDALRQMTDAETACLLLQQPNRYGQPLGLPLGFGGPYLGFMAADEKMMRKLPGRIVGETTDMNGTRCYVLTLQAREQHIRREKAGSNICSNEALCALTAAVYLAAMGPENLKRAALTCHANAASLKAKLTESGMKPVHCRPFFHEFVMQTADEAQAERILAALDREDILGGLPLGDGKILWCATEMNTPEEIGRTAAIVKEVLQA